jgi:hypothetical protein
LLFTERCKDIFPDLLSSHRVVEERLLSLIILGVVVFDPFLEFEGWRLVIGCGAGPLLAAIRGIEIAVTHMNWLLDIHSNYFLSHLRH